MFRSTFIIQILFRSFNFCNQNVLALHISFQKRFRGEKKSKIKVWSKQCHKLEKKHGFRNCVVLPTQKIRPRLSPMPCLLQPTWIDPQVQLEHVPSMLQGVCQGYWFQEVGLIANNMYVILLSKINFS